MQKKETDLREETTTSQRMMKMHADVMFTSDKQGRLLRINEPWPNTGPAARFFLTRPSFGSACGYYREDLSNELVQQLAEWVSREGNAEALTQAPRFIGKYRRLLGETQMEYGPCYWIPNLPVEKEAVFLSKENVGLVTRNDFFWLEKELPFVQSCAAVIRDGQAVSICRSVRVSEQAEEAGLETLERYRGRGYGGLTVAAWAQTVRQRGRIPLYSTSWDNTASQRVAQKLALRWYGGNFAIW